MRKEAIRNESRFASPASSNISSSGFLFCCVILRSLTLAVPLRSLPVPAPSPSLAQNLGWSPPCPHRCCSHQCNSKHCLPGNPWAGYLSANPAILAQTTPTPPPWEVRAESPSGGPSGEPPELLKGASITTDPQDSWQFSEERKLCYQQQAC